MKSDEFLEDLHIGKVIKEVAQRKQVSSRQLADVINCYTNNADKPLNVLKSKFHFNALIFLLFVMAGCQLNNQKPQTVDLPVIDISKKYPKKEIHLQDVADIEYIPLETTDDILLGQSGMLQYISDKYIAINDRSEGIFVFNRNGNIVSHFHHNGNGPQEYTDNAQILFDEKNEEIFVTDRRKFVVYSINGEYKRTLKFSDDWSLPLAYNFDDETMFVHNNDGLRSNNADKSEKPYMLMSKKEGSIVYEIAIRLPVRYTSIISQEIDMGGGQKGFTASNILIPQNNMYYGSDLVIADISSDTIYRFTQNRELIPMLVHTPSVHSSTPPATWAVILTTDKFILLFTTALDLVALEQYRNIPSNILMYEFETGQIYEVSFVNDGGYITRAFPLSPFAVSVPKNMFANLLQVYRLKEANENKQLKGDLEKLVSTLDEEDNPVVAIYKFR